MVTSVRGPRLGLALLVVGCTVGCSGTAGTPTVNTDYSHATATVADTDYAQPTATVADTVKAEQLGPDASVLLPSPDGSKVYSVTGAGACITTLADSHRVCSDSPAVPSHYWASWAPDGHAVAFTDDFRTTMHEPDVWVMSATDGTATDLTDDHVTDLLGDSTPTIDLLPVWRDDSTILFARQVGTGAKTMTIASVPDTGGTVQELGQIPTTLSFLNALAVPPDGSAVAYSVADPDQRSATVHLHRLDPAKGDTVLLHDDYDASRLSFSPDGKYLLVDNLMATAFDAQIDDPKSQVIAVDGGTTTPVADGAPAWYPTWSPTGHALAFLTDDADGTLQQVAEPGGAPHPLTEVTLAQVNNQRLAWTANGLLVRVPEGVMVLTVDNG